MYGREEDKFKVQSRPKVVPMALRYGVVQGSYVERFVLRGDGGKGMIRVISFVRPNPKWWWWWMVGGVV